MTTTQVVSPKPLTEKQRAVFTFIWEHTLRHGHQPTFRDIMREFCFSVPCAATCYMKALAQKGYVERSAGAKPMRLRFLFTPDGEPFRGFRHADAPTEEVNS